MADAHAQPDCVFCGYRGAPVHLHRPRFEVRRCPHCRVLWCDPTSFDDEQIRADDEATGLEAEATAHGQNAARLRRLLRHVSPSSHPRVLEVGCMYGDFVYQARAAGFAARGVELSPTAVAEANRRMPGAVSLATLDSSFERDSLDSLDVVAAFDVFERMDRPDELLDQVVRTLRPGGVLIAETPAQESLHHHLLFLRGRAIPAAELDVGVHPGARIFEFGRRSWATILSDRGFEVLGLEPRSTPLRELVANDRHDPVLRAGILGLGLLGRVTGWEDRVLVVARLLERRSV